MEWHFDNNFRDVDTTFDINGIKVVVDDVSIDYLRGATIDFVNDPVRGPLSGRQPECGRKSIHTARVVAPAKVVVDRVAVAVDPALAIINLYSQVTKKTDETSVFFVTCHTNKK